MKITSDQRRQFNRFNADAGRKALTAVDPDKDGLQQLFASGGWQDYLVAGIQRFTAKVPDGYDLAKIILGKDFIPPEEIAVARGLTYTYEQLVKFGDTLPAKDILEWCRDNGMMLVAGPPIAMSLLYIRSIGPAYFYSKGGGWYAESKQKFARTDKAETVWIALRKEPVADSLEKNWSEQSDLVTLPMVVPNAAEVVWGLTVYKAVRGEFLLSNFYVRTSSFDLDGFRVSVGDFVNGGLTVDDDWDSDRNFNLGVASARKF